MAVVVMPRLSDSMEEGTIVRWCKRDSEDVRAGDELVEIETDKATVTYEAESAGALRIVAGVGQTVAVGAVIAEIGEPVQTAAAPVARRASAASLTLARAVNPTSINGTSAPARAKASPVARRLAERLGIELATVSGTGPSGRIVKRDIEAASSAAAPAAPAAAAAREGIKGDVHVRDATSVQSTIARRMSQAKSTMPEFTLTTVADMDELTRLRAQLKEGEPSRVPSINDFVVKACALALRAHPKVNGSYRDGVFEIYSRINIGVAVAAPDVLLVPTVFDADTKSLGQIASETQTLASRARDGTLTPGELTGGTFTISNLGMYGITQFTAVLNPPQAAILAVGSLEQHLVLRDGVPAESRRMSMTLTCDHRILYGADAAAFLKDIRLFIEQPLRLVL